MHKGDKAYYAFPQIQSGQQALRCLWKSWLIADGFWIYRASGCAACQSPNQVLAQKAT